MRIVYCPCLLILVYQRGQLKNGRDEASLREDVLRVSPPEREYKTLSVSGGLRRFGLRGEAVVAM
jgi:hypothetical protein